MTERPSWPMRVQLSRRKGWKMPPNTVSVARPGKWGNPFRIEIFGRDLAVTLFERSVVGVWTPDGIPDDKLYDAYSMHCLMQRLMVREWLNPRSLRGYNLACWCQIDKPCHADVLLEIANR